MVERNLTVGITQNLYSWWQGREIIAVCRGNHNVQGVLLKYIENISTVINFGLCPSCSHDHFTISMMRFIVVYQLVLFSYYFIIFNSIVLELYSL